MAFKEISVADILGIKKNEVVTTSPETTIMEAARLLTAKRIGVLLVRKAGEDVVGLLSERDIIRAGVGLVWKIQVIDLVRFWCRDGRPKTAIRDNGPLQGRILSRRQGRAGEGGNAPHRQRRYDAVS